MPRQFGLGRPIPVLLILMLVAVVLSPFQLSANTAGFDAGATVLILSAASKSPIVEVSQPLLPVNNTPKQSAYNELTRSPLSFFVEVIKDTSQVLSGGITTKLISRSLLKAGLEYSISPNTLLYMDIQAQRGRDGSGFTGDLQAFSNIDSDNFSQIFEAWVLHDFGDSGISVKVGQVDANNEFAWVSHADEFINSSMGFSPTIFVMPTYPLPRLSVNAIALIGNHKLSVGVYANQYNEFDKLFSIAQWRKV